MKYFLLPIKYNYILNYPIKYNTNNYLISKIIIINK